MRILMVFFSVLLAQTSGSFFSDLTNSMSSVTSSIGKLFSDAAVDLKDTFDCTVFVVHHAFSGDSTLPGYEKCQTNQANMTPLSPTRPLQNHTLLVLAPTPTGDSKTSQSTNKDESILKSIPKKGDINTKASIKDKDEIEKMRLLTDLLIETRLLVNMSSKLEHVFEDFSKHVNEDLTKLKNGQKQLSTENIMEELGKLQEEERNYKRSTESEIRKVYNKIINALRTKQTDKFDLKAEIKSALSEFEQIKNQTNVEDKK